VFFSHSINSGNTKYLWALLKEKNREASEKTYEKMAEVQVLPHRPHGPIQPRSLHRVIFLWPHFYCFNAFYSKWNTKNDIFVSFFVCHFEGKALKH